MGAHPANFDELLRDIELGPIEKKLEALGKLRLVQGLRLDGVRPVLDKILERVPDGSALKFFCAVNLATRGDQRRIVADILMPYMDAKDCLENEYGKPIAFPWLSDCARSLGLASRQDETKLAIITMPGLLEHVQNYPEALGKPGFVWQHSVQLATLEAVSHLRTDNRVADTLVEVLGTLPASSIWRPLYIYALGALGNPDSRRP